MSMALYLGRDVNGHIEDGGPEIGHIILSR